MKALLILFLLLGGLRADAQWTRVPVGDLESATKKSSWDALKNSGTLKGGFGTLSISSEDVAKAGLALTAAAQPVCAAGSGLACLPDGVSVLDYALEWDAAVKGNIILGSLAGGAGKKVFVHDLMFVKNEVDQGGQPLQWGAGVRLVIVSTQLSANASFSSLPAVAASAEFHYSEASYQLRIIGLTGPKVIAAIPQAGSYNVETHVNLMKAIDHIRDAAGDATTIVTPQVVTVSVRDNTFYVDRLARDWALQAIVTGKSCKNAKGSLLNGYLPAASTAIESEYNAVAGKCDNNPVTDPVLLAQLKLTFSSAGLKAQ